MELRRIESVDSSWLIKIDELTSKSNYRKGQNWSKHKNFKENIQTLLDVKLAQEKFDSNAWVVKGVPINQRPSVIISLFGFTLLDSDNALKSIQDCFEGIFYLTDASVRHTSSFTIREKTSEDRPVYIGISRVDNPSSAQNIFEKHNKISQEIFSLFMSENNLG